MASPVMDMLDSANLSVAGLLESTYSLEINMIMEEHFRQSKVWQDQFETMQSVLDIASSTIAVRSHLAEIAKYSGISQTLLSQLDYENIGNALNIEHSVGLALKNSFSDFSRSYSLMYDWMEREPSHLFSLTPNLSRLPSVELFNNVTAIDSITINSSDFELREEKQEIESVTTLETRDKLDELLTKVNPDFLVPLSGARRAAESTNPDRARHLSSSLRELFTHVIHTLVPNEKVQAWSTDSKYYDRGRPTRRARLLCLCQKVDQDSFSEFVEKDVEAALAFIDLFQRGTHEVVTNYTDEQMRIMLVRMEALLRYLLEINILN